MYFSPAASSENDHGSMNLASNTAPVSATTPSRVAHIHRITGCRIRRWTSERVCPVLHSNHCPFRASVTTPSWTIRFVERSGGSTRLAFRAKAEAGQVRAPSNRLASMPPEFCRLCRSTPPLDSPSYPKSPGQIGTVTRPSFAAIDPRAIDPLQAFQRAVSFHAQGRLWEAEQLYAIVLQADRSHFDALLRLGIVRLQQGRFDQAARLLRRSIKVDSNSADAHH